MTDGELDEILRRETGGSPPDADMMERVRGSVLASLEPVRPLAAPWVWISALLLVFVVVAVGGGALLGMYGVRVLDGVQRLVIFVLVGVSGIAAAVVIARQMVPAGASALRPAWISVAAMVAFLGAVALLFPDHSMVPFTRGVSCLRTGLIFAAPTAVLVWLILRRGFVLDRAAAGAAAGTLAGLAGLAVLELHCPLLTAPHVLVWHATVVVLSTLCSLTVGWIAARL